ncbi:hypothetical protein MAR_019645 [Mya arenaria]|uniref:Uncharacterized protein n=1 Tax=Mya arenaria TaxID=6604 RepID=A0ABY7E6U2_MYAAR|nr:hypothetical protein MAR_019645 [Mya arenaria]
MSAACSNTSDCASLSNAVCDTIVTQKCACFTSQGFRVNSNYTGCDYGQNSEKQLDQREPELSYEELQRRANEPTNRNAENHYTI